MRSQRLRFSSHVADASAFTSEDTVGRDNDTIYALSSAEGRAGVAVIRISGAQADASLAALSSQGAKLPAARTYASQWNWR